MRILPVVEHFPYLLQEGIGWDRLLEEVKLFILDTFIEKYISRIAAYKYYFDIRFDFTYLIIGFPSVLVRHNRVEYEEINFIGFLKLFYRVRSICCRNGCISVFTQYIRS